jgi:F-type H+-transporting ATPase subunit alpha
VIVDQNGVVTASSSETNTDSSRPIFVPIPKISEIGLIDTPLVTGITAIDALTPIGKGQNMLVIGTQEKELVGVISMDKSNKRAWMINLLKSVVEKDRADRAKKDGPSNNLRCFYGLTAADSAARTNFMKRLENAGIKEDIVSVVSTQSNDCATESMTKTLEAAEAVAVAATACTLGEHHATTGGDALVIVDDINLHKSLWDITTQQLVEIYGVDAVVKADLQGGSSSEMRGYFSGLIQRAARFKSSKGGGSVTLILLSTLPSDDEVNSGSAKNDEDSLVFDPSEFESMSEKIQTRIATLVKAKVPLTATNLKKVQIPLPRPSESEDTKRLALQHVEDLISMSDGQIWFDDELAKMGRSPPLDPSRSIVSQCLPYVCVFFLLETSCTHIAYR